MLNMEGLNNISSNESCFLRVCAYLRVESDRQMRVPESQGLVQQDMPPRDVQEHLLSLYFIYTHAPFPIVRQEDIINQFTQR